MAFKDILLLLDSYIDPTPDEALERAVSFCARLGGGTTAVAVHVQIPFRSNVLAERLVHLSELAHEQEQRSLDAAHRLLAQFDTLANRAEVPASNLIVRTYLHDTGDRLAELARSRDLCVVPIADRNDGQRSVAEVAIFASGRPVAVVPEGAQTRPSVRFEKVVIAWDGSRHAARAVADALPVLREAADVGIVVVLNEKPSARPGSGADIVRHLAAHGVNATITEVDAAGRAIGAVLRGHIVEQGADLLVMGAFGHSRAREFILGGATQNLLDDAPIPVLFSH